MKRLIKRMVAIICFIGLFIGVGKLWRYLLVDDVNSYTRIMMHQLYTCDENIDVMFVGSSHVYRSFIPEITDEGFGCYTFNAGTSTQYMDGSLAIIKEAAKTNDLEHIYLELYYGVVQNEKNVDRTELTSTYIISDYMKFSFNKINYLLKASAKEYWSNSFVVARRNWQKFFDSNYVKNLLISKSQATYKNYEYNKPEGAVEYYVDRGFVANDAVVAENTFFNTTAYNPVGRTYDSIKNSDWEKTLGGIVKFCNRKGIALTFFITPEPEWTLVGTGDYSDYHEAVKRISQEYGIEFYDFNLCRDEVFDTNNRQLFMDADHLNSYGAEKFSRLFSDFFTGKYAVDDVLYSSFEEKISEKNIKFYGVAVKRNENASEARKCRIISGNALSFEYQIIALPYEGEQRVIQNFDSNLEFEIPGGESGTLTISWKPINNKEDVCTVEFAY